jgi:predicted RNase H-like HicB family nuclease
MNADYQYVLWDNITPAGGIGMETKMTMIYWKGEKFWLGKLLKHPEIMTQGETLEELEENIKDAYLLMAMDEVPEEHQMKEVAI